MVKLQAHAAFTCLRAPHKLVSLLMLKVDVITYQAMASQQSMLILTRGDYVWLSYSRLRIILKMVKISIKMFIFSIIYRECFQKYPLV